MLLEGTDDRMIFNPVTHVPDLTYPELTTIPKKKNYTI